MRKKKKDKLMVQRPLETRTIKEEPTYPGGGRDSSHKKTRGMKTISKQSLEPLKFVPQEVNSQEYVYVTIEIGEWMKIEEHKIEEVQEDQIDPTLELQQQEQTQITSLLQS